MPTPEWPPLARLPREHATRHPAPHPPKRHRQQPIGELPVKPQAVACRVLDSGIAAAMERESPGFTRAFLRAGKGVRTLDPELGKLVLYQLS